MCVCVCVPSAGRLDEFQHWRAAGVSFALVSRAASFEPLYRIQIGISIKQLFRQQQQRDNFRENRATSSASRRHANETLSLPASIHLNNWMSLQLNKVSRYISVGAV